MEVEIDISEENAKTESIIDFLSKVTIEKIGERKFIVKFDGKLKHGLQTGDLVGFLLWHWYFSVEDRKQLENQKSAKKEGFVV